MYEFAYARALEAIATGETREWARAYLTDNGAVPHATFDRAAADALTDALRQGVKREDIDPSWLDSQYHGDYPLGA